MISRAREILRTEAAGSPWIFMSARHGCTCHCAGSIGPIECGWIRGIYLLFWCFKADAIYIYVSSYLTGKFLRSFQSFAGCHGEELLWVCLFIQLLSIISRPQRRSETCSGHVLAQCCPCERASTVDHKVGLWRGNVRK
jgi:hypothetical protein